MFLKPWNVGNQVNRELHILNKKFIVYNLILHIFCVVSLRSKVAVIETKKTAHIGRTKRILVYRLGLWEWIWCICAPTSLSMITHMSSYFVWLLDTRWRFEIQLSVRKPCKWQLLLKVFHSLLGFIKAKLSTRCYVLSTRSFSLVVGFYQIGGFYCFYFIGISFCFASKAVCLSSYEKEDTALATLIE